MNKHPTSRKHQGVYPPDYSQLTHHKKKKDVFRILVIAQHRRIQRHMNVEEDGKGQERVKVATLGREPQHDTVFTSN